MLEWVRSIFREKKEKESKVEVTTECRDELAYYEKKKREAEKREGYLQQQYETDFSQIENMYEIIWKKPVYIHWEMEKGICKRVAELLKLYGWLFYRAKELALYEEAEAFSLKIQHYKKVISKEDKRTYKIMAEKKLEKAGSKFETGEYEEAQRSYEKALSFYEKSYANTGNLLTLEHLYQKSNEVGVMFWKIQRYQDAKTFFIMNKEYAKMKPYGKNEEANQKALEIAEINLRVIEQLLTCD